MPRMNIYVGGVVDGEFGGLVHKRDELVAPLHMTVCHAFLNATTKLTRKPVNCVQCLAVVQQGGDPWDARRSLGDRTGTLWGPTTFRSG